MDESNTTKYAGKSAVPFGPLASRILSVFSYYAGVLFLHVAHTSSLILVGVFGKLVIWLCHVLAKQP